MFSLVLGNIFSFCAVVCMAISVVKRSKKDLIYWQTLDTAFFIASTVVLSSYSAVVTNTVSLIRNIFAYKGCLTKRLTWIFCFLAVVIGLFFNNRGVIGWLPVIATSQYTICLYMTKNEQQMRWALVFNLMFWCVHDSYIQAYPSAINEVVLSLWTCIQIYRFKNIKKYRQKIKNIV